ncbi:unnamed protein product [Cladocopium goreaui]|uniref:Pentatricopeptide repeat-containing protein, mitochondrial n=1 Tax=Cladocopium goreaui TaxID=2562237 RepID=A0A9P1DLE9_9DINO|nr:unnamed protein product [Cladocopium goreaui]
MHAASHGTARFHLPLRARGAAEVAASKRQSSRVRVADRELSYSWVIYDLARQGKDDAAAAFLQAMAADDIKPNSFAYQAVLNGYAKHLNKWQKAVGVFGEMQRSAIKPTAMHYAAVMDSCGKAGEAKRAERWFGAMKKNFVDPNTVCYNVIINAHARQGDPAGASKWFQRMRQAKLIDIVAYNSLLHSLRQCGTLGTMTQPSMVQEAEKLFRELRLEDLAPTAVTLDLLASIVGDARRDQLCEELDVDVEEASRLDQERHRSVRPLM